MNPAVFMIYDHPDYVFQWQGDGRVYVYEGTMRDLDAIATSTPLNHFDAPAGPLPLGEFQVVCEEWVSNRES